MGIVLKMDTELLEQELLGLLKNLKDLKTSQHPTSIVLVKSTIERMENVQELIGSFKKTLVCIWRELEVSKKGMKAILVELIQPRLKMLAFDPLDSIAIEKAKTEITETLTNWLGHILTFQIDLTFEEGGEIDLTVTYRRIECQHTEILNFSKLWDGY